METLYLIIIAILLLCFLAVSSLLIWKTGLLLKLWIKLPLRFRCFFKKIGRVIIERHNNGKDDPIYPIITDEQRSMLKNAIRLTFTGDLILLRDMVENGFDEEAGKYNFDSMFKYVKNYYLESDLNIGVFEGPVAGAEKGYSTSCFDDGIPIYLNFPKEYAEAVKRAGFDLVTLANNHLLDQGVCGVYNTIEVLNEVGLPHTGAFRNEEEKRKITIVQARGKRIAILAYTYGSNYYNYDFFYKKENRHLTRIIVSPNSKYYNECLNDVRKDFHEARKLKPDLIVVMPHMGEQFRHSPDKFQLHWCNVFVECGANIILSDHPHAVQPIEWRRNGGDGVLIIHCPGNYINSYTKQDGDASMVVEIYLDPSSGAPFAIGCIPIYAYCKHGKKKVENYQGVPVYKMLRDDTIELSESDYRRLVNVHTIITKTALGHALGIDNLQERYYLFKNQGYVRNSVEKQFLNIDFLFGSKSGASNVAFIGDSISEGTKNGGYGWYEPMMSPYPSLQIEKFTKGGQTSIFFRENIDKIVSLNAQVFFIAIGCDDIRYRDHKLCAMTSKEFSENMLFICNTIQQKNPSAKIIVISPWESLNYDPYCPLAVDEKQRLYIEYKDALSELCHVEGYVFIDPNPYIQEKISKRYAGYYLEDHIHPNAYEGINLFSEAVVTCLDCINRSLTTNV